MLKNKKITNFFKLYMNEEVKIINNINGGYVNDTYKIVTKENIYFLKLLNKNKIKNKNSINYYNDAEIISNFVNSFEIPANCAININGSYVNKYMNEYFMVYKFCDGCVITENIDLNQVKKIASNLAKLHNLKFSKLNIKYDHIVHTVIYDWQKYLDNINMNHMVYKKLYVKNYQKYNKLFKLVLKNFNENNENSAICHRDLNPRNVLWVNDNPIIIDWETATIANPKRELVEYSLVWAGFGTEKFDKRKYKEFLKTYFKIKTYDNVSWNSVIWANLFGRFAWLKYNLERSLKIIDVSDKEINISEQEVIKMINEINSYIKLIDFMEINLIKYNNKK